MLTQLNIRAGMLMVFMSAGASLAVTAPALKGCLWFCAQPCHRRDMHPLHKNIVLPAQKYVVLQDSGRHGHSVIKVSFSQTGLGEFLGLSFLLSADDTGNLCLKVLSSLPQLVPRGQQWELLSVTHAFVCKGPGTFIKPHGNEQ